MTTPTKSLADENFPVSESTAKKQREADIDSFIKWMRDIVTTELSQNPYGNRDYYDGARGEMSKWTRELERIRESLS